MLSIMDDSSVTGFLKDMKELSVPGSQLHIETSLTGSDSTVTATSSIAVPSPVTHTHTHTHQMDFYLCFFLVFKGLCTCTGS